MDKRPIWNALWFLIIIILFPLGYVACVPCEQAPERDFTTESLLVEASMFPTGWENGSIMPTADSHGAFEHPSIDVYSDAHGGAVHEIYRYECVNDAQREYKRQLDIFFPDTPLYDKWLPDENLHTAVAFADEVYAACASRGRSLNEKLTDCRILARYQEYVVRFHTEVIPPYLTFDDLVEILSGLDNRFAAAMKPPEVRDNAVVGEGIRQAAEPPILPVRRSRQSAV